MNPIAMESREYSAVTDFFGIVGESGLHFEIFRRLGSFNIVMADQSNRHRLNDGVEGNTDFNRRVASPVNTDSFVSAMIVYLQVMRDV
jgi:hypothetical protein